MPFHLKDKFHPKVFPSSWQCLTVWPKTGFGMFYETNQALSPALFDLKQEQIAPEWCALGNPCSFWWKHMEQFCCRRWRLKLKSLGFNVHTQYIFKNIHFGQRLNVCFKWRKCAVLSGCLDKAWENITLWDSQLREDKVLDHKSVQVCFEVCHFPSNQNLWFSNS